MQDLPKKLDTQAIETLYMQRWRDDGTYRYDASRGRADTFAIDTPPPTVSGSLHVGHVFSYTQTDLVARFWRMRGKNVFYPMGWDDNGLPTERRVQNFYNVRCEPHVPYDPGFTPDPKAKPPTPISRPNFIELCEKLTAEDEKAFEALWSRLGLSVDWSQTYATIDAHCRRVSQHAFLDLVDAGHAFSNEAPSLWDVDFRSAVAQAELEDREVQGLEFRLRFGLEGGGTLPIMTTRPELLAACVAVVVHPEDARFRHLIGTNAVTPLFGVVVPIHAHEIADPEKGTGAVMVCTYGDVTDVQWHQELSLPTRVILGREGRLLPVAWGSPGWESLDTGRAGDFYEHLVGLTSKQAKKKIAELLAQPDGAVDGTESPPLDGEPKPVTQAVKFYEKGDRPLEVIPTRQWFIRLLDKKDALVEAGRRIAWRPDYMRQRYEHWVEGLKYDWCVSRQRYFGVPVPVWYQLDRMGEPVYDSPLFPTKESLPVDPMSDVPPGFTSDQRDQPGGFTGDPDVFDTWATSSLTPQVAAGYLKDDDKFASLYPMDMRPQAHEIIRTWAFYTIARAHLIDGRIPWQNAVISGWVLDPDRKKMSKSKGNVVTPMGLLENYGADAVRYWSARARLGTDTAYDESVFKVGRRLVTKVFNASKLVIGRLRETGTTAVSVSAADVTAPLDRAFLAGLAPVVERATAAFESFETAEVLALAESWFWASLCDNYLELSKERAYAADSSALATWTIALSTMLRLLAPFLPFISEAAWSWHYAEGSSGPATSVHRAPWPTVGELGEAANATTDSFDVAVEAIGEVRRIKSERDLSIRVRVPTMTVRGPQARLDALAGVLGDVLAAANVDEAVLDPVDTDGGALEVDLADAVLDET